MRQFHSMVVGLGLVAMASPSYADATQILCGAVKNAEAGNPISLKRNQGACRLGDIALQIRNYGRNSVSAGQLNSCVINLDNLVTRLELSDGRETIAIKYAGTPMGAIRSNNGVFYAASSQLKLDEKYTIVCADSHLLSDEKAVLTSTALLPGPKR